MSSKSFVHWLLSARAIGIYLNTLRWKVNRKMDSWILFWRSIWILPLQSSSPISLFKICIYNKNYCLISRERMQSISLKAAPSPSLADQLENREVFFAIGSNKEQPFRAFRAWRTWVGLAVCMFATINIFLTLQVNIFKFAFRNRNWMRTTNRLVLQKGQTSKHYHRSNPYRIDEWKSMHSGILAHRIEKISPCLTIKTIHEYTRLSC